MGMTTPLPLGGYRTWLQRSFLFYLACTLVLAGQFIISLLGSMVLELMDGVGWCFYLLSCLSHAATWMLPSLLLALLLIACTLRRTALVVQGVLATLVVVLAQLDAQVFAIYRFHINGFVLNMVFGPGAGEIFTFDLALYLKEGLLLLSLALLVVGAYFASRWIWTRRKKGYVAWGLGVILGATVLAHGIHIWGSFVSRTAVVQSAKLLPYYFPTTAYSLMNNLGFHSPNDLRKLQAGGSGLIAYPVRPLVKETPDSLPNILIILLDSWNKRALTPECMPHLYRFAQENQWYTNHFSGSNGTRSGVFSFFFGLSCYYWEDFEAAGVRPVFIDRLLELGYDCRTYPSATLENPNFAKILFSRIPNLRKTTPGETSQERDARLTADYLSELPQREASGRPLFSFLFLDLPHSFEPMEGAHAPFQPAWPYADYTKLKADLDPEPFFNLYRNTCYRADELLAPVLERLRATGALENTLVIISGDHGQEFNENGRNYWGHNGNFSAHQLGVPLIVHFPQAHAQRYSHRTTHYDLVPTLLSRYLGVRNDPSDYSMGRMLDDPSPRRWQVVGSNLNYAFILPGDTILEKTAEGSLDVYDARMKPVPTYRLDPKAFNAAMERLNHFYKQ